MPFACTEVQDVIKRGVRLRGSHPAVRAHPDYFVPDGQAADELPVAEIHVPEFAPELSPPHRKVAESEQVVAVTGFAELSTGRSIKNGQLVARDEPVVQRHPEHFRAIAPLEG